MIVAAIPHDEEERLSALHSLGLVGSVPEDSYDGLVACAAQLCACPIALISLADRDREWFKSAIGTALTGLPRDQSICGHALAQSSLFEVHDLAADPRFTDHPLVVGEPFVRFYAGFPLRSREGRNLRRPGSTDDDLQGERVTMTPGKTVFCAGLGIHSRSSSDSARISFHDSRLRETTCRKWPSAASMRAGSFTGMRTR